MEMEEGTYELDFLLKRAYSEIENIQQKNKSDKLLLSRPEVTFANKRTFIKNFKDLSQRLNRKDLEIKAFFDAELNAPSSIDGNGMLVIQGRFRQNGIQKVLTNYIKQYLLCSECKSTDTEIIKENRITFMQCKKCRSKKAI